MDLKQGTIVEYEGHGIWVQYYSLGDINGCIIFDGNIQRYASLTELKALDLPIGLSALGFIEMGKDNPIFPNTTFYRKGGMEVSENENSEYFIGDRPIKFTHEVQEIFDLFELLPKNVNRVFV